MQFNNEKVCHVPRLLQSSMQPNAREESENEVRKWWCGFSAHLSWSTCSTRGARHIIRYMRGMGDVWLEYK